MVNPTEGISVLIGDTRLTILKGDITTQKVDAIVNAANSRLAGGGGVDGAIHRRGGPQIMEECRKIAAEQGGCPTGQAVVTSAGRLPAKYVIHAVGPIWHGGNRGEPDLLASAYRNSLRCAVDKGARTVALPSISTGAYGYPIDKAARIALSTIKQFIEENKGALDEVRCVLFSDSDFGVYETILPEVIGGQPTCTSAS
ncbi:MAG TPA: O-acetyl-ADP-ribose deacetylase [Firmicutes bacterium]|nr:O-acetyl-ADP-ribose deacetylase [Bacillota bacterium]